MLRALGRFEEARGCYDQALELDPTDAEVHYNRALTLLDLRHPREALASLERSLTLDPRRAERHVIRGNLLQQQDREAEALEAYQRAIGIAPRYAEAWNNRGAALQKLQRLPQALQSFDQALTIDPALVPAHNNCGNALQALGRYSDALDVRRLAVRPELAELHCNRTNALSNLGRFDDARAGYDRARRIQPEYEWLLGNWLHTKMQLCEWTDFAPNVEELSARVAAAFDPFIDVGGRSDAEVAHLSRTLEIDIAIDLKGYTQDKRTGIFAHRAVPRRFRSAIWDIRARWGRRLGGRPEAPAASRAELGLPADAFVYCCFNNHVKITPPTFDGWMRILHRVPGSVLWLLVGNGAAAENLRREAEQRGVNGARLIFAQRLPARQHLARHRAADLFLDTLPYNAHTTATDALWAGLPVLTRLGESFTARVAGSLLIAVGLPELVTRSQEEYETLAIALANEPDRLALLRATLRANRATMPLFDTRLLTRHLELAYAQMYERHHAGLQPDHIEVCAYANLNPEN